tara:strand:+ start:44582 stop:44992 length:411 start_codon:yes stop_codon:yes gene_type:complete
MINERSVNFVNKFFDRITELNNQGVNLICDAGDVNIDKAAVHILPVPNDNDGLIVLIRHMSQIQARLSEFMKSIELWDKNATWAYSMANSLTKTIKAKNSDCYIRLRTLRGDKLGFGHGGISAYKKNITGVAGGRD